MEIINYDKLLQSIELVAYNKLDECRDDTLIEKLVTFFDQTFQNLNCSNDHLNSIFNLCVQAISDWKANHSLVYISPVFSFIFKLISSLDIQNIIGRKAIIQELNQLIELKSDVLESDYSIQSNYVKGLCKLFLDRDGSKFVFEERLITESFVQSLIDQGLNSKSFFVKESIQQCLIELFRRSCEYNDEITVKYFNLIISSFELKLNKFQIKIIGQLVSKETCDIRSKINKLFPDLNQKLISHINSQTNENVIIQLAELLANHLDNEFQINFVFIKLIKNKLIKPLITFSTYLASFDSIYLNKWFTFTLLPLELEFDAEESLKNKSGHFNYSEFDLEFVKLLTNEKTLIYCLHFLKIKFPKQLTNEQLDQVFDIISQFITKLIQENKVKLLRESLLMIGSLSKQFDKLDSKKFSTLINILINLLWSKHDFQCECLIWLRHLFEGNFKESLANNMEINLKIIDLIDQILKLELKDENLDVIDGGLELLDITIKNNYLQLNKLDESVLKSIISIWNYSTQHSHNNSLKASCVSILLNFHLQLDKSILNRISMIDKCTENRLDIYEIIWKCLKDENSLVRRKVIDTIRENILYKDEIKDHLKSELMKENGKLYLDICYNLSENILFDIDADIQLAGMNLLKNFIINLIDQTSNINCSIDENLSQEILKIKLNGLIYFVHCLHSTIMNNLVCYTVKEECLCILELIKSTLNQNSINKSDLKLLFSDYESKFEYKVNCHQEDEKNDQNNDNKLNNIINDISIDDLHKRRDEHLDEMFKDNLFRTEEIISQFTNERVEKMKISIGTDSIHSNNQQKLIINKMKIGDILEFIFTFDPQIILNNEIKVDFLDDILAARANDDVIIDCY